MSPDLIFNLHLVLGYVAWLLSTGAYLMPWLKGMSRIDAQRAIAALHSFRFFGLVFIVPGIVGQKLPADFATFAAYGDFATGLLAMLALATFRVRPVFWLSVVAFNVVGVVDLVVDYYHGVKLGLGNFAGELGAGYPIIIIYVPLLAITHYISLSFLLRSETKTARALAGEVVAS